jgi:hypothetical protein
MVLGDDVAKNIPLRAGGSAWRSLTHMGGVRRRMLGTFPFSSLRAHNYRKRLAAFSQPRKDVIQEEICCMFNIIGALMPPREDMARLFNIDLSPLCENARAALAASPQTIFENEAALALCPDFYRVGLSPAVLDLAEACLGLDCLYLGATLKREKADGRVAGTRQWHLDIEDEKLFRILLYLAPVTPDDGPFEFFPRAMSQTIKSRLHYHSGYVADTQINAVAPIELPRQCTGEVGDAVIFDGAGIFHRGKAPIGQDRYSVTFAYCSRRPLELRPSARLPRSLHQNFLSTLSTRQCQTIPPPR